MFANATISVLGLTLKDAIKVVWKAGGRWRRLLHDSIECKELALRIPATENAIAVRPGGNFVSQCLSWLHTSLTMHETTLPIIHICLFRMIIASLSAASVSEITTNLSILRFFLDLAKAREKPATTMGVVGTADDAAAAAAQEFQGLATFVLGLCLDRIPSDEKVETGQRPFCVS